LYQAPIPKHGLGDMLGGKEDATREESGRQSSSESSCLQAAINSRPVLPETCLTKMNKSEKIVYTSGVSGRENR
jgi:hypothetical protein